MELIINLTSIYLVYNHLYFHLLIFQILASIYIWSNEENMKKYENSKIIKNLIYYIIIIKNKMNNRYYNYFNQEYKMLVVLIKDSIFNRFNNNKSEVIIDNKFDRLNQIMNNTFNLLTEENRQKICQDNKIKEYIENLKKVTNSNKYKENVENKKLEKIDDIIKNFLNKLS